MHDNDYIPHVAPAHLKVDGKEIDGFNVLVLMPKKGKKVFTHKMQETDAYNYYYKFKFEHDGGSGWKEAICQRQGFGGFLGFGRKEFVQFFIPVDKVPAEKTHSGKHFELHIESIEGPFGLLPGPKGHDGTIHFP